MARCGGQSRHPGLPPHRAAARRLVGSIRPPRQRNREAPAVFDTLSDRLSAVFTNLRGKGRLSEPTSTPPHARSASRCSRPTSRCRSCGSSSTGSRSARAARRSARPSTPRSRSSRSSTRSSSAILGGETRRLVYAKQPPTVIMLAGLQGAGKTTLAGKLAHWLREQGHTPLLVACDLQRPNAVNQLQIVGERAGVPTYAPRARQRRRRPGEGRPRLDRLRPARSSTTWSSSTPPAGSASTPR